MFWAGVFLILNFVMNRALFDDRASCRVAACLTLSYWSFDNTLGRVLSVVSY